MMPPFGLPPEDRPPEAITDLDAGLRRQLEFAASKHFFEACEGSTQALLMECRWTLNAAQVLTLVIYCSDPVSNWRVLNHLSEIAYPLAQLSSHAKIRVYPPLGTGGPFDMRVDERSEYRDRISD